MAKQQTAEKKQEFKMEQVLAMWKRKSKAGKDYFSGKDDKGQMLTGFYNSMKKNPKEPDVRIYLSDKMGKEDEPVLSLWCNLSKAGKKYLSSKYNGKKVVGFINENAGDKRPYFSVYYSEGEPQKAENKRPEPKDAASPDEFMQAEETGLPF